jgi:hypothetical protein
MTLMKAIKMILLVSAASLLAGCTPTLATRSLMVTTYPDGKKETVELKQLQQTVSTGQIKSTDDVLSTCGK